MNYEGDESNKSNSLEDEESDLYFLACDGAEGFFFDLSDIVDVIIQ